MKSVASSFRRLLLLLVLLSAMVPGLATATDFFGHPDTGAPVAAPAAAGTASILPQSIRHLLSDTITAQRSLTEDLHRQMTLVKNGASWRPAAVIILLAFLYGMVHALGPGHGKIVVGGYLLTHRARVVQGLAMSGAAALVQAVSAILLVTGLVALLHVGLRQMLGQAERLESVSYALIALFSLGMIRAALRKDGCCAHAGMPGHDHHHDHDHEPAAPRPTAWRHALSTGAAIGLRPCTGAILVLLFALANGILPVGILATLAMAVGVMITVSTIGLAGVGTRRLLPTLGQNAARSETLHTSLALGGALLITLFGAFQAVALWTGLLLPTPG
jgi:nickel/cobalt exporter